MTRGARLSDETVAEIRRLLILGLPVGKVATKLGVARSTITKIKARKCYAERVA